MNKINIDLISKCQSQPIEITRQNGRKNKAVQKFNCFFWRKSTQRETRKKELDRNSHGSCENMADGRILRDKIKGGKFLFSEKMMAQI